MCGSGISLLIRLDLNSISIHFGRDAFHLKGIHGRSWVVMLAISLLEW